MLGAKLIHLGKQTGEFHHARLLKRDEFGDRSFVFQQTNCEAPKRAQPVLPGELILLVTKERTEE
jgi:hypothetical protein